MNIRKKICLKISAVLLGAVFAVQTLPVFAETETAHDSARDVQAEGVGNPFNYGERFTPENASTAEIRALNHAMSVQEVKYALYKEIDEHWDLISVRLGQPNREMVYALFLGIGTRESTLGGNGDGADIETAQSQGFGVSSAHAYGTLQTAVTAFADANPEFMKEDDVPEMYQYSLTESNFYDAIISDHMGIRKIMHFVHVGMTTDGLTGYQVVRGALKGFNTGWSYYVPEDEGYYKDYPDEIIALARWYYEEGHLYDNVFTWTNDERVDKYRQGDVWAWWGDVQPSLAEIGSVESASESETESETESPEILLGDVNLDKTLSLTDVILFQKYLSASETFSQEQYAVSDMNQDGSTNIYDFICLKKELLK